MIPTGFARGPDGSVSLTGLSPALVHVLHEVPGLLASQDEAVKERLFPAPTADDDEEARKEWERLVHPELFALVASAREVVAKDLAGIRPRAEPPLLLVWDLEIPAEHVNGWLSALNAARLTIGALHGIEESDMHHDEVPEEWDEREMAVVKIHLLGWLQQVLLEGLYPPPELEGEEDFDVSA